MDNFEHYQVLKDDLGQPVELGHGGMGVTYKAFDTSLCCYVALKVIGASLLGSSTAEVSPAELRVELKRCLDDLRGTASSARFSGDPGSKTIHLKESRSPEGVPVTGSVLKGRYLLIEDLNPAQPGSVFHAEDEKAKQRVAVRMLHGESSAFSVASQEAACAREAGHPSFVKVLALEKDGNFSFIVFEWMEGFSLIDLVRARRELSLREAPQVLSQLAVAANAAANLKLKPDISLGGVFIQFPEGLQAFSTEILLNCPVDEWPVWRVKIHVVAGAHELDPAATIAAGQIASFNDTLAMVSRLAAVTYGLLGGDPKNFIPLGKLDLETTGVLRRGISGEHTFSSATEFYNALKRARAPEGDIRRPALPLSPPPGAPSAPSPSPAADTTMLPPLPRPRRRWSRIVAATAAAGALLAGVAWAWISLRPGSAANGGSPAISTPKISTSKAAATLAPPQRGKPWTNSLGISFVPLGDIHMASFETRVRDFEAFVQATQYDSEGGMVSAIKQDSFARRNLSWKSPGFPQTPDDPVVGVCWEDADQFCEWLTKKERSEGAITAFQRYRLPTDREWSEAVGLSHEEGATPEERSGRIKNAYPWNGPMPPPEGAGNYAGEESRQGAPASWNFLRGYRDAFPRTGPVQAMQANSLGLYGLGGNIWEWCNDRYNQSANWRVLRGGSWATSRPEEMLSSYRRAYDPLFRMDDAGFRLVIAPEGNPR